MIETANLVKEFGDVRALDGLDLHVRAGTVYGLVGPNGAGKTTALAHIAGVYRPTGGEVRVGGEPVFERPDVKETIAFIPSDLYSFRQARVSDIRDLHAALQPRFSRERFDALAGLFDLDAARTVRSLSKGMAKQLAFQLALAQHPDVLLLDEPLDGLDPAARRAVLGVVMEEVAERGMTVLVSSHNLRELSDICDHVGIMEAGRMRLERSLAELQENFVKVQVAFGDDGANADGGLDEASVDGIASDGSGCCSDGNDAAAGARETTNDSQPVILRPEAEESPQVGTLEIPRCARNDGSGRFTHHFTRKPGDSDGDAGNAPGNGPLGTARFAGLDIVSAERQGKLHTIVVRASADAAAGALAGAGATFVNVLPLSLEEIFVYEIGGAAHERELVD